MKPIQNALLPLSYYIDESIAFLREHEPQEGFFVGFSGGKDSIVTLALCRMAGVKHTPYYTYTTIDPPEVAKFIRTEYPDVNWLRPKKSFFAYVQRNAPPYGCKDGAVTTLKKCLRGMFPCTNAFLVSVPRKVQSVPLVAVSRKSRLRGGVLRTVYKPIFHWPEWAVWDFIALQSLAYPSLYDEGFHRIGCIICPFIMGTGPAATKRRALSMERWPGTWKAFEHAVKRWFIKKNKTAPDRYGYNADEWYQNYLIGFEREKRKDTTDQHSLITP